MKSVVVALKGFGEITVNKTNIRTVIDQCAGHLALEVAWAGYTGFSASFFGNSYVAGVSVREGKIFSLADQVFHYLHPAFARASQKSFAGKNIELECINGGLPGHNAARNVHKLLAAERVTPDTVSAFVSNDIKHDPNFRGLLFHRRSVQHDKQYFTELLAPRPNWLQSSYVCLGAGEPLDMVLRGGLSQLWHAKTSATKNELLACQHFLSRLQEINPRLRLIQLCLPAKLLASWPIKGHLRAVNQLFAAAGAFPLQMWGQKFLYRGKGVFGVDIHPDEFGYQLLTLQAIDAFTQNFEQSIKKIATPQRALVKDCQLHQRLAVCFSDSLENVIKRSTPEFWQTQFEQLRRWFVALKKCDQYNEAAHMVYNWDHYRYSEYWYHSHQIYTLFSEFIEFLKSHL